MKTIAVSLLASFCLFGCASDNAGDAAGSSAERRGPGDVSVDPVSGQEVRPGSAWKTQWKGRWYYFESEENLRRFETNPTAYAVEDGRAGKERLKVYPHEVR